MGGHDASKVLLSIEPFGLFMLICCWLTKGWFEFRNYDNKVQLFYSHPSADEANSINSASRKATVMTTDWDCAKVSLRFFFIMKL